MRVRLFLMLVRALLIRVRHFLSLPCLSLPMISSRSLRFLTSFVDVPVSLTDFVDIPAFLTNFVGILPAP
jgi:hypothetical protein